VIEQPLDPDAAFGGLHLLLFDGPGQDPDAFNHAVPTLLLQLARMLLGPAELVQTPPMALNHVDKHGDGDYADSDQGPLQCFGNHATGCS